MKHVLVVDDDVSMRSMVAEYLAGRGLEVSCADGGTEMQRHLDRGGIDLVVLDLRLDAENGLDLLRNIKSSFELPVIVVTGDRRDEVDRVIGLELGADDYLTKPFGLAELLARIRAVLRRLDLAVRDAGRAASGSERTYHFAGYRLRAGARSLSLDGGRPVELTAGELSLLLAFLQSPQQVLTREQLQNSAGISKEAFDRSIDVQVLRLRRKLEADPSLPAIITTSRGVGYMLAVPVTAA